MKKRFIILVDFSESSEALIKYASDWGRQIKAELLLVHQSDVLTPGITAYEVRQELAEQSNEEALQRLKTLAGELIPPSVKVSFSSSERHLLNTIPHFLADPFDHLVFAGIKGSGFLKRILLGSTALQVIDNTKNIVVAMPKGIDKFSPQRIFVAVTKKYPLNVLELKKFLNFIDDKNANITFLHLTKPHNKAKNIEKYLHELTEIFADKYKADFTIYEGDHSFDDIKKVINNRINEILVIQKGSRLLTDQLFRRFLINELVYEGQTPLVVLP